MMKASDYFIVFCQFMTSLYVLRLPSYVVSVPSYVVSVPSYVVSVNIFY